SSTMSLPFFTSTFSACISFDHLERQKAAFQRTLSAQRSEVQAILALAARVRSSSTDRGLGLVDIEAAPSTP
ncbi:MAG: hypothetical protein ABI678_24520, partial [Kofleriaceae bacterium]